MTQDVILRVRGLTKRFGAVSALEDVSFEVERGACVGIIGPNGSGKTTLFNTIAGFHPPTGGSVEWLGEDVTGMAPEKLVARGLARTFQSVMTFSTQSALANVRMAFENRSATASSAAELADPPSILRLCGLEHVADVEAGDLAYGLGRRLGIAVALAGRPGLVMLDEPASGLNDMESSELATLLLKIRATGTTLIIVDHDMPFLMPLVERLIVLDAGRKLTEGSPAEVRADERVVSAYLGSGTLRSRATSDQTPDSREGSDLPDRPTLVVTGVRAGYGPNDVLGGVSLTVRPGQSVAVLGANGAGKTTLMRTVAGVLPLTGGSIEFGGVSFRPDERLEGGALLARARRAVSRREDRQAPRAMVREGLVMVPEGRHIITSMTVRDNLLVAAPVPGREATASLDWVVGLLPALKPKLDALGGSLSGGQQQMLAVGRGLMAKPRLLCLDEPSLGLSPAMMEQLTERIAVLREEADLSLLIVEQSFSMALALSDEVFVMSSGKLTGPIRSTDVTPEYMMSMYMGSSDDLLSPSREAAGLSGEPA